MEEEKMIRTAGALDVFFKVLQRIVVITAIVLLCVLGVLTAVNRADPEAKIGEGFEFVDVGPVTLELPGEYAPDNGAVLAYAWVFALLGGVIAAASVYGISRVRRILAPMKEGRPFRPEVSKELKKLAWTGVVIGVAVNLAKWTEGFMTVRKLGLAQMAADGYFRAVRVNFTVDLSFLVVFFLLMLMSYIFRYGSSLQQLSDETL